MNKRSYFLKIFKQAEKKYGSSKYRLAGDAWPKNWQTLIATIMSAQSRDETTIPIAESLFSHYDSLGKLANAKYEDVLAILKSLNYNRTKSKNVIAAAKFILENYKGSVPDNIEDLVEIPGVGRKTANLVLAEVHSKNSICVDTHVHRISNVFGFVKTKTPNQTELALMNLVPRNYWSRINRIFVLWGKEVRGKDKNKFIAKLQA